MHYFSNKFSKIAKRWGSPHLLLTIDIDDLKLRDWTKLWLFKLIMTKSNYKKSVMTSSILRHQNNVKNFFHLYPPQSKFLATPMCTLPLIAKDHRTIFILMG